MNERSDGGHFAWLGTMNGEPGDSMQMAMIADKPVKCSMLGG